MECYYSEDNTKWIPAREYQKEAVIEALDWFQTGNNTIFKYNKNYIIMTISPISLNGLEKQFMMTRENGSVAYLKLVFPKYTKMDAQPGSNITADYMGQVINIAPGSSYYIDNTTNKIVVGWHGSYNPPCGMDGYPFIL